ncbi:prepilin peptidase [uncultured Helicobacter sp.]|uniref:prepilin peptidase n=1 Tax=uncultured Helicobacter sp. TaxID=175537 RepID=UPI00262AF309|nr:prepilin peptidase [uncultured Helicobacter sp.]
MLNEIQALLDQGELLKILIVLLLCYAISTVLISFFGKENKTFLLFLKQSFFSYQSLCIALSIPSLMAMCSFLYGYGDYAWFVFGICFLFLILGWIDCYKLAVPDILNFSLLFYVFFGLYFLDLLSYGHFISSFSLVGAFALLRMLGGFVFAKEIMGEADLIVMGSIGALFSFVYGCYVVVASSFLAILYILILSAFNYKNKTISFSQIKIPFICFLFLGFILGLIYEKYPIFGVLNV